MQPSPDPRTDPSLVAIAIAIAARKGRDRELERAVLRTLLEEHGLRLSFCRHRPPKGARDAR